MFLTLFAFCLISRISTSHLVWSTDQQCKPAEVSVFGKALRGHTFNTVQVNAPRECQLLCDNEKGCLSYNFVIATKLCELNNTTKEARPNDYVSDESRFYKAVGNRAPLGHMSEMPAVSCMEIAERQGGKLISGLYWLGEALAPFLAYCHITLDEYGWTLIARFSNNDTLNWMADTGYFWYDIRQAFGDTIDPLNNTDMISPAFWMTSGQELKITRSDDPEHTALLQTTDECLAGQTFRSKITSYGDFREKRWHKMYACRGTCPVQYGGLYETTAGFSEAKCNGDFQTASYIGFWCDGGWDGSVIMIGGGGEPCSRGDHGIGVTGAKEPSFRDGGRGENDFGDTGFGLLTGAYGLNLWIR